MIGQNCLKSRDLSVISSERRGPPNHWVKEEFKKLKRIFSSINILLQVKEAESFLLQTAISFYHT